MHVWYFSLTISNGNPDIINSAHDIPFRVKENITIFFYSIKLVEYRAFYGLDLLSIFKNVKYPWIIVVPNPIIQFL